MASQCCCRRMHAAAPSTAAQLQQAGRRVNQLACMPTIGEQLQQPGVLLGSHPPRNLQERGQAGGSLRERQSSVYPAPISHASCLPACLQGAFGSVPWQPVGSHIIVERDDQHASWQHKGEVGTLWLEVTTVCKISATWNSTHRWQERQQAACRHGGSLPHRQGRSSTAALARAILAGGRGGGRGGGGIGGASSRGGHLSCQPLHVQVLVPHVGPVLDVAGCSRILHTKKEGGTRGDHQGLRAVWSDLLCHTSCRCSGCPLTAINPPVALDSER